MNKKGKGWKKKAACCTLFYLVDGWHRWEFDTKILKSNWE